MKIEEKVAEIIRENTQPYIGTWGGCIMSSYEVANAILALGLVELNQARQIVNNEWIRWGYEPCPHQWDFNDRQHCRACWDNRVADIRQALKEDSDEGL